jgi:hypothetical protein
MDQNGAILDPIITTLSQFYQEPLCLDPLDADPDKNGVKSDHRIVVARAISTINNKSCRQTREIKVRPMPESGIEKMKAWFIDKTWEEIYNLESAHDKAELFQKTLLQKLDEIFPEKVRKINSDDQPWISHKLKKMDRQRKRIFNKERSSAKWKIMNKLFKKEMKSAKSQFYQKNIAEPGQWYSCLRKITSHDQHKSQVTNVEEISHLTDQEQVDLIAVQFDTE